MLELIELEPEEGRRCFSSKIPRKYEFINSKKTSKTQENIFRIKEEQKAKQFKKQAEC